MKLLILESNVDHRLEIADILASAGYEVFLANTVEEAVTFCQITQPLIVMFGWDGEENLLRAVSQELKNGITRNPYLVLMKERMSTKQIQFGLRCGFDDFIFQPKNPGELIVRAGIGERILGLNSFAQESDSQITAPKFSRQRRVSMKQKV